MFYLIKITKKNLKTLAIYDNYVFNVYYTFYIGSYTDDNLFYFDTFILSKYFYKYIKTTKETYRLNY